MEKLFVITLLVANFAVLGDAQDHSPSPAAVPQNPSVAASPAPTTVTVFDTKLVVSLPEQKLAVVVNDKVYRTYKISTSRYGEGDALGSWCTPTGRLAVATKIGAAAPVGG